MGPHDPHDHQSEGLHATLVCLVQTCFGSTATLARVTPLAGDASSRRYFRLSVAGCPQAPATVVAMVLGADRLPLSSAELTVFETPPTELPYVNVGRFLASVGVRIPRLYHYDSDGGVLLLEDIGDLTLRSAANGLDEPRLMQLFRAAIDQLVCLQITGSHNADPECIAFQQRFDQRLLAWELDHFLEYGLPPEAASEQIRIRDAFSPLVDRLADAPARLAHRDFHGWNLHVHDGGICVIDFQDALLAPETYDLASLLTDRDTDTLITPERERVLIDYFLAARRTLAEEDSDPTLLRSQYFLCVLHRALKVLGRFRYLAQVKHKPGYLRYVPHVAAQARRALEATPQLKHLRRVLLPHLYPCAQ